MTTRERLCQVQLALGWVFTATCVAFAVAADFAVPYRDDWGFLANVSAPLSFGAISLRVNEHFVPLPWLLTRVHFVLEGAVGPLMLVAALAFQAAAVAVVLQAVHGRWRDDRATARLVSGAVLSLLWFAYQLQSFVFDAAVMFPMVQTFATVAVASHLVGLDATTSSARRRWRIVAAVACLGAVLSTTSGLAVPWILVLMSLLHRERLRSVVPLVGLGMAALVAYLGLTAGAWRDADQPPTTPGMALEFFLAFPASFVAHLGSAAAIVTGSVLIAASAAVVWAVARSWREAPRIERFAVGLLLFVTANDAMLAIARSGHGVAQVAQSRYATSTVAGWTALLLVVFSRWVPQGTRTGSRPAALVVAATLGLLPLQLFSGLVWIVKADHLATARQALVVGVHDAEWIAAFGPSSGGIDEVIATITARGDRLVTDSRLGQPVGASVGRTCAGRLSLVRPPGTTAGWRVVGSLDEPIASLVIADRDGVIRGVARRRPIAMSEDPRPVEVVRAVETALTSASVSRDWLGFSQDGAGGPYAAYGTGPGSAVCRLDVVVSSGGAS